MLILTAMVFFPCFCGFDSVYTRTKLPSYLLHTCQTLKDECVMKYYKYINFPLLRLITLASGALCVFHPTGLVPIFILVK